MFHPQYSQQPAVQPLRPGQCTLIVRQQPVEGVVASAGKTRKPIDPPPIIQVTIPQSVDPGQQTLQSPYLFVHASLLNAETSQVVPQRNDLQCLIGTTVSSLQRLKDDHNSEGGFFVFGDLSSTVSGKYRIRFTLVEFQPGQSHCQSLDSIDSDVFKVVASKDYKGQKESTFLTRTFGDQGVRLRIRKEVRGVKRGHSSALKSPDDSMRPNSSTSYDNSSPSQKRFKSEADDRKDSIREAPAVPMTVYSQNYASTPSVANYPIARPTSISNSLSYSNDSMGLPSSYANNPAVGPSYRSSILSSASTYANTSFQNNPNGMLSGPATFSQGFGNMYTGYNQRSTPSESGDFQGSFAQPYNGDPTYQQM
ncbi:velvet factor-domain-containing protein [Ampelomyces quisqualis]|uniref:Velvet factor-domain-containing protein n=1 Tax=Ampelomyces quisqualis TaxID=50730 RepID=A0A6A5Q6I6_AMPQU|nr:velvet factor-domain-containing protein [Ampelomyces quisqualis]